MSNTLPIPYSSKRNFQTLVDAVHADHICLMSVFDAAQGRPATVICAVNHVDDDESPYEFVPLAMLCEEDPYSRFDPPFSNLEA